VNCRSKEKSKEPAGRRRYGMDCEDARMIFFCREGVDRFGLMRGFYWARTRSRMRRKSVRRFGPAPAYAR
jgi:hypothetical protein